MSKISATLLPHLRQEFVLVVFLMIPYAIQQLDWTFEQKLVISNVLLILMIVWLVKVFFQSNITRQYKGFIVLITGLSLFSAGLFAAILYYVRVVSQLPESILGYAYLFFPIWVMLEGVLMLFLLGFDSSKKNSDLEHKIQIGRPRIGDFFVVTLAAVLLVFIGEWVLYLPWYMNVCVVFTVNLIMINQFAE